LIKDGRIGVAHGENITTDTFFNGRVAIHQSTRGYRFSLDAVLLAALPRPKPGDRVMDIGTGCGILPILLAFRNPEIQILGIELQRTLAQLAEKNVVANQLQDRVTVIHHDVRHLKSEIVGGTVDWIVSNPPYRSANTGRINPNAERAMARHEIHLTLRDLILTAKKFLRTGGQFAVIYPSERMVDLFYEMRSACIEPKWIQSIHSRQGDEARLMLVQGRMRGNSGLKVAPPLIIYGADGSYSKAVEQMMEP
jgi:tRNA1Val (adenine37-N6)-methyltransferase